MDSVMFWTHFRNRGGSVNFWMDASRRGGSESLQAQLRKWMSWAKRRADGIDPTKKLSVLRRHEPSLADPPVHHGP